MTEDTEGCRPGVSACQWPRFARIVVACEDSGREKRRGTKENIGKKAAAGVDPAISSPGFESTGLPDDACGDAVDLNGMKAGF